MKNLHIKRTSKFRKSFLLQLKLPKYYKRMLFKSIGTNIINMYHKGAAVTTLQNLNVTI